MATIFSRIISGELPGTFVWRDDDVVAFMSINPLARGHVLLVPVVPVDHWIDADATLCARLFEVAREIGIAQETAFDCERVGLVVAGYEIPHAHLHLIPTNSMSELSFSNAASTSDPADLEAAADAIRIQLRHRGQGEFVASA